MWALVLRDEHQRASDFGREALLAAEQFIAAFEGDEDTLDGHRFQFVNAASNVALARMALGEDPAAFLATWREDAAPGHEESMFYSLVTLWTQGGHDEATRGFRELPADVRNSLSDTVTQLIAADG